MEKTQGHLSHSLRDYATHSTLAGIFLAATGAAPEHWFAEAVHLAHLPEKWLPHFANNFDWRLIPVCAGLSIVVGAHLWKKSRLVEEDRARRKVHHQRRDRQPRQADAGDPGVRQPQRRQGTGPFLGRDRGRHRHRTLARQKPVRRRSEFQLLLQR